MSLSKTCLGASSPPKTKTSFPIEAMVCELRDLGALSAKIWVQVTTFGLDLVFELSTPLPVSAMLDFKKGIWNFHPKGDGRSGP